MDAKDEARDKQMRKKDKKIGDLIDKLTSMSITTTTTNSGAYNSDRTNKRGLNIGGRNGGGGGGGGGGGTKPVYNWKYKTVDGGEEYIGHKSISLDTNWSKPHQVVWTRSKLYNGNPEEWKPTKYDTRRGLA